MICKKQVISSEELRSIVSEAGEATPNEQHPQMLLSILDMETVTVDDIMVPPQRNRRYKY